MAPVVNDMYTLRPNWPEELTLCTPSATCEGSSVVLALHQQMNRSVIISRLLYLSMKQLLPLLVFPSLSVLCPCLSWLICPSAGRPSVAACMSLSVSLSLSGCLSVSLCLCLFVSRCLCLSACLSLSVSVSVCMSVCLPPSLPPPSLSYTMVFCSISDCILPTAGSRVSPESHQCSQPFACLCCSLLPPHFHLSYDGLVSRLILRILFF